MFALSAAIIIGMTLMLVLAPPANPGALGRVIWGTGGVLFALSMFFLWSGMWRFWTKFDESSRWIRRVSFILLVVGIWYGAVVYYLLVYLPATSKQKQFQGFNL